MNSIHIVYIITGGEDDLVRIWDIKFNLIKEINNKELENDRAIFSPQSIDTFLCM